MKQTTSKAYHAIGSGLPPEKMILSKSLLWKFGQSPYLWKADHDAGTKFKVTDDMEFGSLVDCLVTSPDEWESLACIFPFDDYKTKEARIARDMLRESGRIPIKQCEMNRLDLTVAAAISHLKEMGWRDAIHHQVMAQCSLRVDGTLYGAKALADFVCTGTDGSIELADLKTTGINIEDDREVRKQIANLGYHVQAAWYIDIFRAEGNKVKEAFTLHFVKADFPHRTRAVELTPMDIQCGREWYLNTLATWHDCATLGNWPEQRIQTLTGGLPSWVLNKMEVEE